MFVLSTIMHMPLLRFPNPRDEDAFLRSYGQRCELWDVIASMCIMTLLLSLAGAQQGFGSHWSVQPHAVVLLMGAYSVARLLYMRWPPQLTSEAGQQQSAGQPLAATEAAQGNKPGSTSSSHTRTSQHAKQRRSHRGHPRPSPRPPASSPTPQASPTPTNPTPASHWRANVIPALDTLLGHKSRHYVLLAILVFQPFVLLGAQLLAKGSGGPLAADAARQITSALLLKPQAFPLELPRLSFCVPVPLRLLLPACVAKLLAAMAAGSLAGQLGPLLSGRSLALMAQAFVAYMLPPVLASAALEMRCRSQFMESKAGGGGGRGGSSSQAHEPQQQPDAHDTQADQPLPQAPDPQAQAEHQAQLAAAAPGPVAAPAVPVLSNAQRIRQLLAAAAQSGTAEAPAGATASATGLPAGLLAAGTTATSHYPARCTAVAVSVKVPTQAGQTFQQTASQLSGAAERAVQQAVQAAGGKVMRTSAAATHGTVHLVLTADLALPQDLPGQEQVFDQIQGLIRPELANAGLLTSAGAQDGSDLEISVAPAFQDMAALLSPVCLPLADEAEQPGGDLAPDGPGSWGLVVEVAEAAALASGLATGAQVVVLVDDSSQTGGASTAGGAAGDTASEDDVATGGGMRYDATVARQAGGTHSVSCEVEVGPSAAVLQVHLLPGEGCAAGRRLAASLPLLVLPETAAQEVQALYARMVEEVQADADSMMAAAPKQPPGAAAASPPSSRHTGSPSAPSAATASPTGNSAPCWAAKAGAYCQSFAPFARAWAPLLGAAVPLAPLADNQVLKAAAQAVSELLLYLERMGMPACLLLALSRLQQQPLLELEVAQCLAAGGLDEADEALAAAAAASSFSSSPSSAAWHSPEKAAAAGASQAGAAAQGTGQSPSKGGVARTAAGPSARAAAAAAATAPAALVSKAAGPVQRLRSLPFVSAMLSALPSMPGTAQQGSSETLRYDSHKGQVLLPYERLVGAATTAYLAAVFHTLRSSTVAGGQLQWLRWVVLAALAIHQLPFATELLAASAGFAPWHRKALVVACIVAAKGLMIGCIAAAFAVGAASCGVAAVQPVLQPVLGHLLLPTALQGVALQPSLPLVACEGLTMWLWSRWLGWPPVGCVVAVVLLQLASLGAAALVDRRVQKGYRSEEEGRRATG